LLRLDTQRRMEAARALYAAHGFREIPDYNGNPRAQIWMEATLTAGLQPASATGRPPRIDEAAGRTDAG
jgi:hypothetical protein